MKEYDGIKSFYNGLKQDEKADLCKALADDMFFLEENVRNKLLALLHEAEPEIYENICRINDFTT